MEKERPKRLVALRTTIKAQMNLLPSDIFNQDLNHDKIGRITYSSWGGSDSLSGSEHLSTDAFYMANMFKIKY